MPGEDVLDDAVRVAQEVAHDPAVDGPHVVTGPVEVRGAPIRYALTIPKVATRPAEARRVFDALHDGEVLQTLRSEGLDMLTSWPFTGTPPDSLPVRR